MPTQSGNLVDVEKAKQIWEEYARTHDLTGKERLAAGIDSNTGDVFLGESADEITRTLQREGRFRPLFFRWVNRPCYFHSRGRRIRKFATESAIADEPVILDHFTTL